MLTVKQRRGTSYGIVTVTWHKVPITQSRPVHISHNFHTDYRTTNGILTRAVTNTM